MYIGRHNVKLAAIEKHRSITVLLVFIQTAIDVFMVRNTKQKHHEYMLGWYTLTRTDTKKKKEKKEKLYYPKMENAVYDR